MNYIFAFLIPTVLTGILVVVNRKIDALPNDVGVYIAFFVIDLIVSAGGIIFLEQYIRFSAVYNAMLLVLILMAVQDVKEKYVSVYYIYVLYFLSMVMLFTNPYCNLVNNAITGFVMLIVLFVLHKTAGEKVGNADLETISALSFALGYPNIFSLLFAAMLMAVLVGLILIIAKKANIRSEIPFIPFILIGYILIIINFGGVA